MHDSCVGGCFATSLFIPVKMLKKIAEFIFLSLEAEKPDMIRNISYDLGLSSPKIVGIPFYRTDGSGLVDGILGIDLNGL